MQILYESAFSIFLFDSQHSILIHRWYSNLRMTDEEFYQEHIILLDLVKEFMPLACLSDASQLEYLIMPDMQERLASLNRHFTDEKSHLQKVAIIPQKGMIEQLSTTQNVEGFLDKNQSFKQRVEVKFFDREIEAMDWISL
jgi:hypothetical protein